MSKENIKDLRINMILQETKEDLLITYPLYLSDTYSLENILDYVSSREKHDLHIGYVYSVGLSYGEECQLNLYEKRYLTEKELETRHKAIKNLQEIEEEKERTLYEELKKKYG